MKTPDEIKQDIIDCMDEAIVVNETGDAHDLLDFADKAHVCMATALAYIQQLENENNKIDSITKYVQDLTEATKDLFASQIKVHEHELAAVKRERDAAVKDMEWMMLVLCHNGCFICKNRHTDKCFWERQHRCEAKWRGVCPENTEVQDDY